MIRVSRVLPSLLLLGVVAACGSTGTEAQSAPQATPRAEQSTSRAPEGPPPAPEPVADGPCPYLDTGFVAEKNGQLVPKVRLSADEPTPTCFFYASATEVQLTVRVYEGEAAVAKSVVDEAAPIADSNPAKAPAGWEGGSLATGAGAVYAVAKGGSAVVVTSNQKQTVKPKQIAEEAITNLGL
ncbi:DUF2020 domain-containing protein [Umezawaea beigongshangensis]|uniref:DUF2020 domain-containing protein n=1 Tax=Umezawaea beigongshangensis TaxID=2780383 RepID=UPI0018F13603|nr:DUF2020 domain-containing protein [Umezawaea beigongshangensis]